MRQILDPKKMSSESERMLEYLKRHVLFQDRALKNIVRAVEHGRSPIRNSKRRPIASFLFLGPSGVGKTETAHILAEYLFGDRDAITIIHGSEYSESHTATKLIGSPPSYVGYDKEPVLSQRNIDQYAIDRKRQKLMKSPEVEDLTQQIKTAYEELKTAKNSGTPDDMAKLTEIGERIKDLLRQRDEIVDLLIEISDEPNVSILLFDEIEKAHPRIWNMFLQILHEGSVFLGDGNTSTDFTNTIIIMTSNIGSTVAAKFAKGGGEIGFSSKANGGGDHDIYTVMSKEARKVLPSELVGRIDKIEVFRPLGIDEMRLIVENKLQIEALRLSCSKFPIVVNVDKRVKDFIANEACDHAEEGARLLEKKIHNEFTSILEALIASEQLDKNDTVFVTLEDVGGKPKIMFSRETDTAYEINMKEELGV